jgi:hypothetical protein
MAKTRKTSGKPGRGHDGKFLPGTSGNPKGRPRKAVQALHDLQYLLLDAAPGVVARLVISAVSDGDTSAARILLDNLPRVDSRISLDAGDKIKLDSAAGVLDYSKNIIELTANGALSVSQGEAMGRLLDKHSRLLEAEQLEARIEALEAVRDIA